MGAIDENTGTKGLLEMLSNFLQSGNWYTYINQPNKIDKNSILAIE